MHLCALREMSVHRGVVIGLVVVPCVLGAIALAANEGDTTNSFRWLGSWIRRDKRKHKKNPPTKKTRESRLKVSEPDPEPGRDAVAKAARKTAVRNMPPPPLPPPPPPSPPPPPPLNMQRKVYQRPLPSLDELRLPPDAATVPTRSRARVQLQHLTVATGLHTPIQRLAAETRVPLHETVVAFDCDLTLKAPGGVLRGGDDTIALLDALRDAGATVVVVTATRPSRENWDTIVRDLGKLGVLEYLGQEHGQQQPPSGLSTWSSENGKYTSRCWESCGTTGTPFVAGQGVICSHYNKAACLHRYLLLYGLQNTVRHLVFVDDFVANVVDVALHFSIVHELEPELATESAQSATARRAPLLLDHATALWWDPAGLMGIPVGGYEDSHTSQWDEYRGWICNGVLPDRLFAPASKTVEAI